MAVMWSEHRASLCCLVEQSTLYQWGKSRYTPAATQRTTADYSQVNHHLLTNVRFLLNTLTIFNVAF